MVLGIRKEYEALTDGNLEFMESDNKMILAYSRVAGDSKIIVTINFDYTHGERQWANLKLADNLGIKNSATAKYRLRDVLNGESYVYTGAQLNRQFLIALDQFRSHIFVVTEES